MGNDQPAGADQRNQLVEIIDIPFLVGVKEQDINGFLMLRDRLMGIAEDDSDQAVDASLLEVVFRDFGSLRIDFVREEMPVGRSQRQCKPNCRLTGRGTDLHDCCRPGRFREQPQQASVLN